MTETMPAFTRVQVGWAPDAYSRLDAMFRLHVAEPVGAVPVSKSALRPNDTRSRIDSTLTTLHHLGGLRLGSVVAPPTGRTPRVTHRNKSSSLEIAHVTDRQEKKER